MKETTYTCDGCGQTIKAGQDGKVPITPMRVGDKEYDLCDGCASRQKAKLDAAKGKGDDSIVGNYKWAVRSAVGAGNKAVGFVRRKVEGRSRR